MRARRFRGGIRAWLVLLVVTAALPGGVLLLRLAHAERDALSADLARNLARTAILASEQLRARMELAHGVLTSLADLPEVRAGDEERCTAAVRRARARERAFFANVAVASARGEIICSANPVASAAPNIADRLYFRRAMAANDLVIGEYILGRVVGRPVLTAAYPIFGERGERSGVAYVTFELAQLEALLAAVPLSDGEVLTVIDASGTIVARHPRDAAALGRPDDARVAARILAERDGSVEAREDDGAVRLYAYRAVRVGGTPTDLVVSARIEPRAALGGAARRFKWTVLGYILASVGGASAAWFLGEFAIARRLRRVGHAARRLARGDLAARTGMAASGDDVGALGASFDEMATAIEGLTRQNRLLLDAAGFGIFGVNRAGAITFVNPAAARTLGYAAKELLGRPCSAVVKDPPDAAPASARLLAALADGEVHRVADLVLRRKSGEDVVVEAIATPLREGDAIVGAVITLQDLTDRRRLESALRHAQKMEAVGRLAGGIAHDFNNLLTVLMSAGAELVDGLAPDHPLRADAEDVLRASERAAALTRQLLAFSRKSAIAPAVLDPNAIVGGVRKLLERLVGHEVVMSFALAAEGHVRADPGQLEQVVVNLALNARDAMPHGGHLRVETSDVERREGAPPLGRRAAPPGRYVAIAVVDSGSGMDEHTLARMFEPFFTTKDAGKGTGLGLATVWGILEAAGGDLAVASAPGRGTTFHVFLPRVEGEVSGATAAPARRERGAGEAVLVVDDDPLVRGVASRALAGAGYSVVEASGPAEALRLAAGPAPLDLLLTDVMMPELSGPDLAERVLALRPGLRVVFMSGFTGSAAAHAGVLARGDAYVQKPFAPGALLAHIRSQLARPREPG